MPAVGRVRICKIKTIPGSTANIATLSHCDTPACWASRMPLALVETSATSRLKLVLQKPFDGGISTGASEHEETASCNDLEVASNVRRRAAEESPPSSGHVASRVSQDITVSSAHPAPSPSTPQFSKIWSTLNRGICPDFNTSEVLTTMLRKPLRCSKVSQPVQLEAIGLGMVCSMPLEALFALATATLP